MPIDITKIKQPISIQLKVVKEIPKNVNKANYYTVKYDEYLFYNVCAKIVHYKKKYNKIVYYLYTMKEPILNAH